MDRISALAGFAAEQGIYYRLAAPMAEYTSFKIGGPADILLEPENKAQLKDLLGFCRERGIRTTPLGRGSNLLVSDGGIEGAVIRFGNRLAGIELADGGAVDCMAGTPLAQLCKFARDKALSGLEFAYGIPGSVGGAVYMNAGAYGGEIRDVCVRAEYLCENGDEGAFDGEALGFSYRHSVFCGGGRYITGARFALIPGDGDEISARMEELLARRFDKQPMDVPSAGSTFKRPEGAYASALIDQCGLKGFSVGGAQVSEKHAGFVVNRGGAACADVLKLIDEVRERVLKETGFELEPEIEITGRK